MADKSERENPHTVEVVCENCNKMWIDWGDSYETNHRDWDYCPHCGDEVTKRDR